MKGARVGYLFIALVVLEVGLSLGYGYSEPFGNTRIEIMRATRAYVDHPTPLNKAVMDEEWDRFHAPDRKRNRIILVSLTTNSILLGAVAYSFLKGARS